MCTKSIAPFIFVCVFALSVQANDARAAELDSAGATQGERTHFQISGSDYLNIGLDSTEVIALRMKSMSNIIMMKITPTFASATSTQITMTGFAPNTTYYKYEDNYHNLAEILSDGNGAYSYTQDISKPHRIFIQPKKSTKFIKNDAIGGDCASIGIWNAETLTCTLTTDLAETVQIDSDGITLDGGGHIMRGSNTGSGIYLYAKSGITLKNLTIKGFSYGITLDTSGGNLVHDNNVSAGIVSGNMYDGEALTLYDSDNNEIYNNIFSKSGETLTLYDSNNNVIHDNVLSEADEALTLYDSNNNVIHDNTLSKSEETLTLYDSNNNVIHDNTLSEADEALTLYDSGNNEIYNNNFINNNTHLTDYSGINNALNRAAPEGGNYFDTFDEPSEGCDDANADGFCDAPYAVDYSGGQDALPWMTQDGWKIPKAPQVSSVLFLPGLEASRLYMKEAGGNERKLWEPNTDSDGNDLMLATNGKSVRTDIYTKDVVDETYVSGAGLNIYKSFIDQMNELKAEKTIADWAAIPYDWRLSLDDVLNYGNHLQNGSIYYSGDLAATTSPYIIQELRRLAKSSKTGKVTIVAHSNGGLVAKALTEKLGIEAIAFIDKIIFVAVPQAGTPQAVGALLHGYEQGLPKDWLSVFLSSETARTLAKNMPSAYNLLPSENYFTYVDNPVVTFDNSDFLSEFRTRYGSQIHDGAQLRNFITDTRRLASSTPSDLKYPSVGNAELYSLAETVHSTQDAWVPPSGVSLYEIAGWGEDTLATIEYYKGKKASCSNSWDIRTCSIVSTIIYSPKEVVEGDGTVLVPSALWTPAATGVQKYWVNLRKYDELKYGNVERKHADILEIPELRTLIQSFIANSTSTLPAFTFISTTQPIPETSDNRDRLRFILHSPLSLSATDNLGNVVNQATSTIPGSRWKRYGEVQVLTVPAGTPITLNLDGYTAGSFTLDLEEIDGNNTVIASSTFSAIPSATSTSANIAFTDGTIQNASPLLLDYDGDGTTDFSLAPKLGEDVVFDITPPEAVIILDPLSHELRIIGMDNISDTTISTTATSTTITDESGNTLQIVFKRLKQNGKQIKLELQELRYNDISVEAMPKTVLQYEWSTDKTGKLKELEEKAVVGALKIEGHYSAKKNATRIEEKIKNNESKKESKKSLRGLVVISLTTENGEIVINY